jgi:carboxymethylenebutenolidase
LDTACHSADGEKGRGSIGVVVRFDGDKMVHEHLYRDQASVLVQLGLLEPGRLPVVGADSARSLLDRSIRLNGLLQRSKGR